MTTFNVLHLNAFIAGYIEAMFFAESATDSDGEEIESLAGYELSAEAVDAARLDCARFMDVAPLLLKGAMLAGVDYDHTQAGRDLWFSRQGHGVGFWDRGLGAIGDKLHDVAQTFGSKNLFINDAGFIEVE
ncbi:hypothetical protein [Enterobacter hormaechei]|uniref:hypothetical protein n=1 Tax=Enterobacter hormaechei TaxID=158836 RepID=UPI0030760EC9